MPFDPTCHVQLLRATDVPPSTLAPNLPFQTLCAQAARLGPLLISHLLALAWSLACCLLEEAD